MKKEVLIPLITTTLLLATEPQYAEEQTLTARGEAEMRVTADQVVITLGVTTEATTATAAIQENGDKMRAVIAALQNLGFNDYQTASYTVTPTYTSKPQDPPPNWRSTINGYRVTNTLQVTTEKLAQIGQIIDHVNKAGSNSVTSIDFTLKDAAVQRSSVITAATTRAIANAKTAASAANVELGQLISLTLAPPNESHPKGALMLRHASTPIEPGDIILQASVAVVYKLD